jgi:hypothetical protein
MTCAPAPPQSRTAHQDGGKVAPIRYLARSLVTLCLLTTPGFELAASASAGTAEDRPPLTVAELADAFESETPVVVKGRTVVGDVELDGEDLTTRDVTFRDRVMVILGGMMALRFVDTTFAGPVELYGGEGPGSCYDCSLTGTNVSFEGRVTLQPKNGAIELVDSTFSRPSEFVDTFSSFHCRGCLFKSPVQFRGVRVDDFNFRDAVFDQSADFFDVTLERPRLTCFRGKPISITWDQLGEAWMKTQLAEARSTDPEAPYEQLKAAILCWSDNFQTIGFERDATKARYAAAKVTREHLEQAPSLAWLFAWAPELVDGWGTRPWQPFVVGSVLILVFWAIFWAGCPFAQVKDKPKPRTPAWAFAFFYSVETFIPVLKVTGIKDWGWTTAGYGRWVEVTEALLGALLTAIAAYTFAANVF